MTIKKQYETCLLASDDNCLSEENVELTSKELTEALADWQLLLEMDLESNDQDSIANDRRHIQEIKEQLREIKRTRRNIAA